MLILHTMLSPEALDDLLADYVTRDGTADGTFTSQDERKAQLLSSLEKEEAFITFNAEYQQPCLITRTDATPQALQDFKAMKAELVESVEDQARAKVKFDNLFSELTAKGAFPLPLGRTTMQGSLGLLVNDGVLAIEQLQDLLRRHSKGDYGVLGIDDQLRNLEAVESKDYMLSRYEVDGLSLYVETYAGHDQTMVMKVSDR
ncbi:YheU family protein [Pseudomonas tritici]|uniref:YheU family protein n=1 Tax=Pseudomonas tritici TaxID=2745518 RepID=UPI00387B679B